MKDDISMSSARVSIKNRENGSMKGEGVVNSMYLKKHPQSMGILYDHGKRKQINEKVPAHFLSL